MKVSYLLVSVATRFFSLFSSGYQVTKIKHYILHAAWLAAMPQAMPRKDAQKTKLQAHLLQRVDC
jgi:hypothetical protein